MTFRPDAKPKPREKKKPKAIKRLSAKKMKEKEEIHYDDKLFYESIWKRRPHKCEMCRKPLGYILYWNFFHHILEKGRDIYKHLRHEDENIKLVCQDCHDKFHSANPPFEFLQVVSETIFYFKTMNKLK